MPYKGNAFFLKRFLRAPAPSCFKKPQPVTDSMKMNLAAPQWTAIFFFYTFFRRVAEIYLFTAQLVRIRLSSAIFLANAVCLKRKWRSFGANRDEARYLRECDWTTNSCGLKGYFARLAGEIMCTL